MTKSPEKQGVEIRLPSLAARLKSWSERLWISSSAQRLMESLTCYALELEHLIEEAEETKLKDRAWATSAEELLEEAKLALKEGDEDRGWNCFLAAQRMELRGLHAINPAALQLRGETLRDEALDKLQSWRKKRVQSIVEKAAAPRLSPAKPSDSATGAVGTPKPAAGERRALSLEEISEIAEILHHHFDNQAVKHRAQRKQLQWLVGIGLTVAGLWLVLLSVSPYLRSQLGEGPETWVPRLTLAVMLFGLLGASLSGILSTFNDPGKINIPELLASFRVTLARLVVGLLSAVAVSVILTSGFLRIGKLDEKSTAVVLFAALVAGFSERLVINALKKAAGEQDAAASAK